MTDPITREVKETELTNTQLVNALYEVFKDETFQFNSKPARDARETAVLLLDWVRKPENLLVIREFSLSLHERFKSCLKHLNLGSVFRNKLWQSFFSVRLSEEFIKLWKNFLATVGVTQTPTLYQHLTTLMFNEEISKVTEVEA